MSEYDGPRLGRIIGAHVIEVEPRDDGQVWVHLAPRNFLLAIRDAAMGTHPAGASLQGRLDIIYTLVAAALAAVREPGREETP